jgi:circadian clock protein KaiB
VEPSQPIQTLGLCQTATDDPARAVYVLRLYITGTTPRSTQAVHNLIKVCQEYLPGRYDLEVVDIYQQPALAQTEDIVAIPTLLKKQPLPVQKLLGDLSDAHQLVTSLGLSPSPA